MRRLAQPLLVAASFAACIACACSVHDSRGAMSASSMPAGPASIRGTVTAVEAPQRIRVEADPAAASGSDKAVVTLGRDTRILHRDGRATGASDIAAGSVVSVWFTGPVRESYPVQADAGTVVIEP